jgi:uncharacterized membrane protein YhaH (DUF805 family)
MKWFIKVLKQYADFGGRARRKEYWMYTLFYNIFAMALLILCNVSGLFAIFYLTYAGGMFLPSLAVAVRRLHDTDRSGWWLLLVTPYVFAVLLSVVGAIQEASPDGAIMILVILCSFLGLAGAIWLFVLLITKGQASDNQYGEDPKQDKIEFYQTSQPVAPVVSERIVPRNSQPTAPVISGRIMPEDSQPVAPVLPAGRIIPEILQPVAPVIPSEQIVSEDEQPVSEDEQPVISNASFLRNDDGSPSVSVEIPDSQEKIPPKKSTYRIAIVCLIAGIVILGFGLLKQTNLLSGSGQKAMSGDLIIEHESVLVSGTFHDINIDDWSENHVPGYKIPPRPEEANSSPLGAGNILGCILAVFGIVLLFGYKRRKANPKTPKRKQPKQKQPKPVTTGSRDDLNSTSTPTGYQVYLGMGACDVCNRSLVGVKAYIVPNSVFYNSRKWRAYVRKNSSVTGADIERMRKDDHSQSFAVCENCIHMF